MENNPAIAKKSVLAYDERTKKESMSDIIRRNLLEYLFSIVAHLAIFALLALLLWLITIFTDRFFPPVEIPHFVSVEIIPGGGGGGGANGLVPNAVPVDPNVQDMQQQLPENPDSIGRIEQNDIKKTVTSRAQDNNRVPVPQAKEKVPQNASTTHPQDQSTGTGGGTGTGNGTGTGSGTGTGTGSGTGSGNGSGNGSGDGSGTGAGSAVTPPQPPPRKPDCEKPDVSVYCGSLACGKTDQDEQKTKSKTYTYRGGECRITVTKACGRGEGCRAGAPVNNFK